MRLGSFADLVLRAGIAFAFLYPPIAALSDPTSWLAYFPHFLRVLPIPDLVLLHGFGAFEVVIALWILSGRRIVIPTTLAAILLLAIVVTNANQFEVLFRDLALAAAAASLALNASRPVRPNPALADLD